jgi:uncharacterized protein (DUF4415 family)
MKRTPTKTADVTEEVLEEMRALSRLPESEIDTDDIPEASAENMWQGVRGPHFRPLKTPVTIRLDADVVAWFKSNAEGGKYQSEINRVLRQHMTKAASASHSSRKSA